MENEPLNFQFPPGVRFHPSDEELIIHYLLNKVNSHPLPAAIISEIELYKYSPWELPKMAVFGDEEWYFFSPRDRKYPNGVRPNRTAGAGYWKATGTDTSILSSAGSRIGVKKSLVFYTGKPPKGLKTDWMMTEYRLPDTMIQPSRSPGSMRLDKWVLCRIRQKGNMSKNAWEMPENPRNLADVPPKVEELPSGYTDVGSPTNYTLPKDCQQLLAYLLIGQDLPPIQSIPTTKSSSNTDQDKHHDTVSDHRSVVRKTTQVISSCFPSYFDPPKEKPGEDILYETLQQPPVSRTTAQDKGEDLLMENMLATSSNFYSSHQSQLDMFKHSQANDHVMSLQELNLPVFSIGFLQ